MKHIALATTTRTSDGMWLLGCLFVAAFLVLIVFGIADGLAARRNKRRQ